MVDEDKRSPVGRTGGGLFEDDTTCWDTSHHCLIVTWVCKRVKSGGKQIKKSRINSQIKLDSAKVVDTVPCEIEDLVQCKDGKVVMCRCWKSKNFPYCDGSHSNHNNSYGDNVGPLIIQKKK